MSLVSSITWVPRGASARTPKRYELDDEELRRVEKLAGIELADAKAELLAATRASDGMAAKDNSGDADIDDEVPDEVDGIEPDSTGAKNEGDDPMSIYNLDDYDNADSEVAPEQLGQFTSIKGLQYHRNNDEDPYIVLKDDQISDEEREELEVKEEDNLVIISKTEDDISQLEVYIYNGESQSMYVHHDLMLPSFPLCTQWLDYRPRDNYRSSELESPDATRKGNFVAVGTFEPEIEIWDLDTVEGMYPMTILGRLDRSREESGQAAGTGKKKKKLKRLRKANDEYHVDAIMSISWNRAQRNLIATSSADCTIKIWDLNAKDHGKCVRSINIHTGKVQSLQWNALEPTVLLSASYDKIIRIVDVRAPKAPGLQFEVESDVERVHWDPHHASRFYVALESGTVQYYDSTAELKKPLWILSAHDAAVSGFDVNPNIPGCFATGSTDKMVKLWRMSASAAVPTTWNITLVAQRNFDVGKVFAVAWSPDDYLTLSVAGSKGGKPQIWEASNNAGVRKAFEEFYSLEKDMEGRSEVVAMEDDSDDESGDEES